MSSTISQLRDIAEVSFCAYRQPEKDYSSTKEREEEHLVNLHGDY